MFVFGYSQSNASDGKEQKSNTTNQGMCRPNGVKSADRYWRDHSGLACGAPGSYVEWSKVAKWSLHIDSHNYSNPHVHNSNEEYSLSHNHESVQGSSLLSSLGDGILCRRNN